MNSGRKKVQYVDKFNRILLRQWLVEHGEYSIYKLSRLTGIAVSTIDHYKYLRSQKPPSLANARKMASVMGVAENELFTLIE